MYFPQVDFIWVWEFNESESAGIPLCDLDYCTGAAQLLHRDIPPSAVRNKRGTLILPFQDELVCFIPPFPTQSRSFCSTFGYGIVSSEVRDCVILNPVTFSLFSPSFQNHRCWKSFKALYWPPTRQTFSTSHPITFCNLSSEVIDRFSGINYGGLQDLGRLHGLTAVWLMLALPSSFGSCCVVALGAGC